ncbi:MAG: carbamoyltransferase N-terminal domain-containing protein, partial [Planctomycetota bacterium]|nr:carbamoyltransferase N-terminal domain-containing protein [Planctomycetota bacterium]
MNIIGLNAYHGDAAAALVMDGQLVAAVEEERFNRVKHWAGFPAESIRWCLEKGGIGPEDVHHVGISFDPKANVWPRLAFLARYRPSLAAVIDRLKRQGKTLGLVDQFAEAVGVDKSKISARFHRIEHHDAHVAAGFLISPFEQSAVLSIDGMGDFTSVLTAEAKGSAWKAIDRVYYPHSLGFLYSAITMYLGFPHYGDEYKVMGLAPYGEPEFIELFRKLVFPKGNTFELNLDYFTHHRRGIRMQWNDGAPRVEPFHSDLLERELGPMRKPQEEMTSRHDNIAKSLQVVTEEIILHLLRSLQRSTGSKNLCLTGGVAMNSVANGKVTSETDFENVYIPAGAADNGTSFGAAFYVWNQILGRERNFVQDLAYWGCEATDSEVADATSALGIPSEILSQEQLIRTVVDLLLDGKVVGWFQGPMEFG